jgi:hypothetical protein
VGIGLAIVTALAVYATISVAWVELMYAVPAGFATILMFRAASLSVDMLPSGMRIRNVSRTVFIPWDRYSRATVGAMESVALHGDDPSKRGRCRAATCVHG